MQPDPGYTHVAFTDASPVTFSNMTVTLTWRAPWWKKPWLWLLGKPTSEVTQYFDCTLTDMSFDVGCGVSYDFEGMSE